MSTLPAKKDGGYSDVEMGPLLGQASSKTSAPSAPEPASSTNSGNFREAKVVQETHEDEKARSQAFAGKVVMACVMYSSCSVGMVLVNKSLASSYNHFIEGNLNILLVVFQAIVAVCCVEVCKKMKWVEYPAFNTRTAIQWAPVNVLFCLMLFTGMASLQHNNVPMVTVFKNVTNIFISAGDYYFYRTPVGGHVMLAFGLMLGGAILAAWDDVYITFTGLFWMLFNCCSTAAYILYLKFATKNIKLSKFGMVFYNNVLCTILLFPVALIMGEVKIFVNTQPIHTLDYFIKNVLAGFVGFFLNFASLNCVSQTGPTTYAIIGSLNKIPISILGWLLFDAEIRNRTWFFIAVSMMGGFLYSYAKIQEGKKKASKPQSS